MSDNNLYLNEFKNDKDHWQIFRDRQDRDEAERTLRELREMTGAERVQKRQDQQKNILPYLSKFRMNLKSIRSEGRIGKNGPHTVYTPAAKNAAYKTRLSRDKSELHRLKTEHGNNRLTLLDLRLDKTYDKVIKGNREAYKDVIGQREGNDELFIWMPHSAVKEGDKWTVSEEHKAANMDFVDRFCSEDEADKIALRNEFIDEVLSYNFSEAMLDEKWLLENTETFIRMTRRAISLKNLVFGTYKGYKDIPDDVQNLIYAKIHQAQCLLGQVQKSAALRGVDLSLNFCIVKTRPTDEDIKGIIKEKENDESRSTDLSKTYKSYFAHEKKRELDLADKLSGKSFEKAKGSIDNLSYEDFATMIGEKNRGQIEMSENGLAIINNGFFSRSKGKPSVLNKRVRERFAEVVIAHLGQEDGEAYRPQLLSILGLHDQKNQKALPLSRELISRILTEAGAYHSLVDNTLKRTLSTPDAPMRKIAQKVASLLGSNPTNSNEYRARRNQINAILNRAAALGVEGPALNDHQIGVLLNGNLSSIRDTVFNELTQLDNRILNLSKGNDYNIDNILGDDDFITKLVAIEIRKLSSHTSGQDDFYESQTSSLLLERAFSESNQGELKNDLENIYIGTLGLEGGADLMEMLLSGLNSAGAEFTMEMKNQANALTVFCDHFKRMGDINRQWLERKTQDDILWTDELEALGEQIDRILSVENAFSAIMPYLAGTRFESGYNTAKEKAKSGFRFAQAGKRLSEKLDAKKHARADLPEDLAVSIRSLTLTAEDTQAYNSLSKEQRIIADILLMKKNPSDLILENEDDTSKRISFLRDVLKNYSDGKPFITTIELAGATMRLSRGKNGIMTLSADNKTMNIPASPARLADYFDTDMADHFEKYGADEVEKIYRINYAVTSGREEVQKKNMAVRTLSRLTGQRTSFFRNIEAFKLKNYIYSIVKSENRQVKIDEIVNEVRTLNNTTIFTEEETTTLVKKIKFEKDLPDVIMPAETERPAAKKGEPAWNETEQKVVKFISDLVFSLETWDADNETEDLKSHGEDAKRGTRLLGALSNNLPAIIAIGNDESLLDKTVERMSFPDIKNTSGENYKKIICDEIKTYILRDAEFQKLRHDHPVRDYDNAMVNGLVGSLYLGLFSRKKNSGELAIVEKRIDTHVEKIIDSMQDELTSIADEMYKEGEKQNINTQGLEDPYQSGITREVQVQRIEKRTEVLNKMMEEESRTGSVQADFTKTILKNYFKDSSQMDKRSMVAAIFRYSVPVKDTKDMPADQVKLEKERLKGTTLGGFLKGAGPLLQKIMQGLPDAGMSEAMKSAIADTRSNLQPIPRKAIIRRLNSIVDRSGKEIKQIEYVKSLGAASVGQAILCRIYGPNLPKDGKEVVVKLLRAEARNRMEREKNLILGYADQVDQEGGMRKTYEGQLDRIEDEFNLTLEEANIKAGTVYDAGDTHVKSMKTDDLVMGTTNSLMLEKAEGSTFDAFMNETNATRDEVLADFYQYDENGKLIVDQQTKRPILAVKAGMSEKTGLAKRKLEEAYVHLLRRQKHLATVADKWVTEAIFKSGYYHGDLHAGNIMANDDGATIIDFGNAVKLTKNQQLQLTKLTAATAVGNASHFLEAFRALLENEASRQRFDSQQATLLARVQEIFRIGTKESTGQMISLALMRAQKLGIEIPGAVQSFSQSQIRLANTMDSVNSMIYSIRKDLAELDNMPVDQPLFDVFAMADREGFDGDKDAVLAKYRELIAPHANEADATPQQTEFKNNLVSIFETKDENTRKSLEKELSYYFNDTENYGNEIKDSYDAYQIALQTGDQEQAVKVMEIFFKYYFQAIDRRLFASIERRAEGNKTVSSFYDVMTDVLNTNLKASLKRVGFFRSIGYEYNLKKKSALEPDARQISQDDTATRERKRLNDIRTKVRLAMPAQMPDAFSILSSKRLWRSKLDKRSETLQKEIKNDQRYLISEDPEQVWNDIVSRHIDAEGYDWMTPDEQIKQKTGPLRDTQTKWKYPLEIIKKAMKQDINEIKKQTDIVDRYEMEEKYYNFFVKLPEQNGGEEFFMALMNGELKPGGKYGATEQGKKDGLMFHNLGKDDKNPVYLHVTRALSMMNSTTRQNDTDTKRYIAKLMMLYSKQFLKGYKVREDPAKEQKYAREQKARELAYATDFKEESAENFILWHKESKDEKPTLEDKYMGPEGREAFISQMKQAKRWDLPGDIELITEFYDICTTCVTGHMKPIVLSYLQFMLIGDSAYVETLYRRGLAMDMMRDLINECLVKDNKGVNCITDGQRAVAFTTNLENHRSKIKGDTGVYRLRYNATEENKNLAQNNEDFLEKVMDNRWHEKDKPILKEFFDILDETYASLSSVDEENEYSAEEEKEYRDDIKKVEEIMIDLETKPLKSEDDRQAYLDRMIAVFGDRRSLGINGRYKEDFVKAKNRDLSIEEINHMRGIFPID